MSDNIPDWLSVFDKRVMAYDEYINLLEDKSTDRKALGELREQVFDIDSDIVNSVSDTIIKNGAVDNDESMICAMFINEALAEFKNSSIRNRSRKDLITIDYDNMRDNAKYEVKR